MSGTRHGGRAPAGEGFAAWPCAKAAASATLPETQMPTIAARMVAPFRIDRLVLPAEAQRITGFALPQRRFGPRARARAAVTGRQTGHRRQNIAGNQKLRYSACHLPDRQGPLDAPAVGARSKFYGSDQ